MNGPHDGHRADHELAYDYDSTGSRVKATLQDGSRWEYGYNDRSEVTAATRKDAAGAAIPETAGSPKISLACCNMNKVLTKKLIEAYNQSGVNIAPVPAAIFDSDEVTRCEYFQGSPTIF